MHCTKVQSTYFTCMWHCCVCSLKIVVQVTGYVPIGMWISIVCVALHYGNVDSKSSRVRISELKFVLYMPAMTNWETVCHAKNEHENQCNCFCVYEFECYDTCKHIRTHYHSHTHTSKRKSKNFHVPQYFILMVLDVCTIWINAYRTLDKCVCSEYWKCTRAVECTKLVYNSTIIVHGIWHILSLKLVFHTHTRVMLHKKRAQQYTRTWEIFRYICHEMENFLWSTMTLAAVATVTEEAASIVNVVYRSVF